MIRGRFRVDTKQLDRLEKATPKRIEAANKDFAGAIIRDIRANWSATSPSNYGSPPAKVTGTLDESLKASPSNRDPKGRFAKEGMWYKIEADPVSPYGAHYASVLEDPDALNRPFLAPALKRMSSQTKLFYRRVLSARGSV